MLGSVFGGREVLLGSFGGRGVLLGSFGGREVWLGKFGVGRVDLHLVLASPLLHSFSRVT